MDQFLHLLPMDQMHTHTYNLLPILVGELNIARSDENCWT